MHENVRVTALCGRFLAFGSKRLRKRTMVSYEQQARLRVVPSLGHLTVNAVTHALAQSAHREWRLRDGPAAANKARHWARACWRWGGLHELATGQNPWHGIRDYEEARRRNPIEREQAVAVRAYLEGILSGSEGVVPPVFAGAFLVALATGLRISNVLRLQWSEIVGGELVIPRHKGRGELRLALNSYAGNLLAQLPREHHRWVFPSERAASGHVVEYTRPWARVRERLGIGAVTLHDMRRGVAQAAWESGATDKDVQLLLGHASVSTTQRYYLGYSRCRAERCSEAAAVQLGLAGVS